LQVYLEKIMKVVRTNKAPDLGKSMPHGVMLMVTAEDHCNKFYAFESSDVWTADGWIVTAVQDDGITHHLRKGTDVMVVELDGQTMFHYIPTPKTKYMLGQ
jgi:hypothetical protein